MTIYISHNRHANYMKHGTWKPSPLSARVNIRGTVHDLQNSFSQKRKCKFKVVDTLKIVGENCTMSTSSSCTRYNFTNLSTRMRVHELSQVTRECSIYCANLLLLWFCKFFFFSFFFRCGHWMLRLMVF